MLTAVKKKHLEWSASDLRVVRQFRNAISDVYIAKYASAIAQFYLQPPYGNGVFANVYLSTEQH